MVLILSIFAMIILNNLVNTVQRMEQEKNTQILKKDNEQKTVQSFFIKTILKEQRDLLENKTKTRTIKAEINTRNFLSKFGKQKCTGIKK